MRLSVRRGLSACALVSAFLLTATAGAQAAAPSAFSTAALAAAAPPAGFQESAVWSGLSNPTAIRFADDGRVFVAEQGGLIKVFDNVDDPTATIYADLRTNVHWFWDRGMLGMELDPQFTTGGPTSTSSTRTTPGSASRRPTWGDACPSPPGPTGDGCVVSGRLSRLTAPSRPSSSTTGASSTRATRSGSIAFGADGALYASARRRRELQLRRLRPGRQPVNPCGDPASNPNNPTPPSAEGGALRSQDVRTTADPTTLDGSIIRVNPDTGAAMPDNPNAASSDPNPRRIIAHGLRNPFRITFRPGHERCLRRRRRLEHLGGDQPRAEPGRARRELRLALLRGRRADVELRQPQPEPLRVALHRDRHQRGHAAAPRVQPRVEGRDETCPTGDLVDLRVRLLRRRHLPGRVQRGALLRRLLAQLHLGDVPGRERVPDPDTAEVVHQRGRRPCRPAGRPRGRPVLRRPHRRHDPPRPLAHAERRADRPRGGHPDERIGAAHGPVQRQRLDPTPRASALSYAWDLDGDGAFDDSHDRDALLHLLAARAPTPRACG